MAVLIDSQTTDTSGTVGVFLRYYIAYILFLLSLGIFSL